MSIYSTHTQSPDHYPDADAIPRSFDISACTHEGKVRACNEDNFAVNALIGLEEGSRRSLRGVGMGEPLICSVFDGTGGKTAGTAASRLAAEYATWLYNSYAQSPSDRERLIDRYVSDCNAYILENLYSCEGRRGKSDRSHVVL